MSTTDIRDGGVAFPYPPTYWPNGQVEHGYVGMSLRSYFAGQAIQGVIVALSASCEHAGLPTPELVSRVSVEYADALIKELGL